VVRDKVVRRPWTRLLDEKDELVRHEIETPNESVEKPQNQNFQKRNSLISIATIFEKCAKFDFFYSLNVEVTGAARLYRAAPVDCRVSAYFAGT